MRTFKKFFQIAYIGALILLLTPVHVQASNDLRQPDPDHPGWIYYQLGLSDQISGSHDRAITNFTTAIQFQPDMADAYEARADSYVALEQYEPAIVDYSAALALKPDDRLLYAKRAFAFAACGDLEQGRADFDQLVRSGSFP